MIIKPMIAVFGGGGGGREHVILRIQLIFSVIALVVRIELLCRSVRRLLNRAYGVAYSKAVLFGITALVC